MLNSDIELALEISHLVKRAVEINLQHFHNFLFTGSNYIKLHIVVYLSFHIVVLNAIVLLRVCIISAAVYQFNGKHTYLYCLQQSFHL
jgi:hypothetical protein